MLRRLTAAKPVWYDKHGLPLSGAKQPFRCGKLNGDASLFFPMLPGIFVCTGSTTALSFILRDNALENQNLCVKFLGYCHLVINVHTRAIPRMP